MSSLTEQAKALEQIAASVAASHPLSAADRRDLREHPYIVSGNLVRWIVDNLGTLADADLAGFFDAVELQLREGPQGARELVTEGILEDLQNLSLTKGIEEQVWIPHLGPKTLEKWRLISALWAGRVTPDEYRRRRGS